MHNFYNNLLQNNVAFGTAGAPKAAEAGEKSAGDEDRKPTGAAEGTSGSGDDEEDDKAKREKKQAELVAIAAKAGVHLDKYDLLRMEAERALKERARGGGMGTLAALEPGGTGDGGTGLTGDGVGGASAAAEASQSPKAEEKPATAAAETAAAAAQLAAGKRRNDESAIMSARERYLARRKQQP